MAMQAASFWRRVACFIAVSSAVGASPAVAEARPVSSSLGERRVTIAIADDPGTLHPYLTSAEPAFVAFEFLYDNLVKLSDDGQLLPNLATEWTYEGNVATFALRDDVTCSDGSPLLPSTVAASLEWIRDPANSSPQIDLTFGGAGEFLVEADDAAGTVTITLAEPMNYFLETTASLLPIACGSWTEDPAALASTASGSGPYVLSEAVAGDRYVLTRNDAYAWGPLDRPIGELPSEIELRVVSDESTAANLIEAGDIDAAIINGPDRQRFASDEYGAVITPIGNQFMFFNQSEGRPTAELDVRRALVMAVDLDQVAAVAAQGLADGRSTSMLEGQPVYCGENPGAIEALPAYDPEGAAALLDSAGWVLEGDVRAKDGQTLTLDAPYQLTTPGSSLGAELIAEAWTSLGVNVELRGINEGERSEIFFTTGQFDVFPLLSARPPSPGPFLGLFGGDNPAGVVDEAFVELGAEALASGDQAEACAAWQQAEIALYESLSYVPVSVEVNNWVTRGLTFRTNGSHIIPTSIAGD